MNFVDFIRSKSQTASEDGFEPVWVPSFLFDFQAELVTWAVRKGRASLFEDCGMGKTPQQLVFAENVVRKTNKPVLILTPLAVTKQTVREAEKFGVDAQYSPNGKPHRGVTVTNYEKLHMFDSSDYAGVVCDESGILKSFDGTTRAEVTKFMRTMPYRLLCTATAAPNDYTELGTSSEALGHLGFMDNVGDTVLTPFMGVGSEVFGAVRNGRRGIGVELKQSYFRQAVKNLKSLDDEQVEDVALFEDSPA